MQIIGGHRGPLGHLLPCHNASCEETPAMLVTSQGAQSKARRVVNRGKAGAPCLVASWVLESKQNRVS